jgi:hypothetical protein
MFPVVLGTHWSLLIDMVLSKVCFWESRGLLGAILSLRVGMILFPDFLFKEIECE